MKRILFLAILIAYWCISQSSFAQNKSESKSSSSYDTYKKRAKSTNDVGSLLRTAEQYKNSDQTRALTALEEAVALSIADGDLLSEAKCYVLIGEVNEGVGEWRLAIQNFQKAYPYMLSNYPDAKEMSTIRRGLGNAHLNLGEYTEALEFYEDAINNEDSDIEKNLRIIDASEVYYRWEKYSDALKTLERIKTGKIKDPVVDSRLQAQQAKIYAKMNDLSKTRALFDNSLNTRQAVQSSKATDNDIQESKEAISDALVEQNLFDDEIDLRNKSIEYNISQKNFEEVTKDKLAIGRALASSGKNVEALKEVQEASAIADTINDPFQQRDALLALARLYEDIGDNPNALRTFHLYSQAVRRVDQVQDSLLRERSAIILKQKDIEELTKDVSIGQREEAIARATVSRQRIVIYGLVLILMIMLVTSWLIYKNARSSRIANQKLALKSLRSQMNPHFIFNALNSVNQFVSDQDERAANRFLSEFSQLMRLVLDNSQQDFIPLNKEHEMLALYLKLEHYRFRDKFDYSITMDPEINAEVVQVPPMLIQPYIENAVWPGLRYKEAKGRLDLRFSLTDGDVVVEISDDGIGRKRSAELKTSNQKKHNSTGLRNIEERLSIINQIYRKNYRVSVEDLNSSTGTRVRIHLPVSNQHI